MTAFQRIAVVPLGMSLGLFFAITYVICVLYGLVFSDPMHQLLPLLFPGFTWISWSSFLIGLIWSLAYGWYVAVVFAPLYNVFAVRHGRQKDA